MNNKIEFDTSVLEGDDPKIDAYFDNRDLPKFLNSIQHDKNFQWADGTLIFKGEKKTGRRMESRQNDFGDFKPQQITAFKPLARYPAFSNFDDMPVFLNDMYRGSTAFLVCSGPSLNTLNLDLLQQAGILKMGVNNSPAKVRPNLWCCVDPAEKFLKSIWYDPTILKFVGTGFRKKKIWDNMSKTRVSDRMVGDCPSVFYLKRNTVFNPESWVEEATFNWGNNKKNPIDGREIGTKTCFLFALKILIQLGVRTIFLVGCDFKMSEDQPYAFDQAKSEGGVRSNNHAYGQINWYMEQLRPEFEARGINVFNTNPDSGLRVFDHVPYESAIDFALSDIGDVKLEVTAGHYDKEPKRGANGVVAGAHGHWIPKEGFNKKKGKKIKPKGMSKKRDLSVLSHKEMWARRKELSEMYPDVVKHMKTAEQKISKAEKDGGCKSCAFNRLTAGFGKTLHAKIQENPEPICHSDLFKNIDIVILSKNKISLRELRNAINNFV